MSEFADQYRSDMPEDEKQALWARYATPTADDTHPELREVCGIPDCGCSGYAHP